MFMRVLRLLAGCLIGIMLDFGHFGRCTKRYGFYGRLGYIKLDLFPVTWSISIEQHLSSFLMFKPFDATMLPQSLPLLLLLYAAGALSSSSPTV